MAEIILPCKPNKRPGPNGIPGMAYKTYAGLLLDVFQDSMVDLQVAGAHIPQCLGERIWRVVPKSPGADRVALFRDLECPMSIERSSQGRIR